MNQYYFGIDASKLYSDFVMLNYKNKEYVFHPFCTEQSQEFDLETAG